jgi:hypothetical protein
MPVTPARLGKPGVWKVMRIVGTSRTQTVPAAPKVNVSGRVVVVDVVVVGAVVVVVVEVGPVVVVVLDVVGNVVVDDVVVEVEDGEVVEVDDVLPG